MSWRGEGVGGESADGWPRPDIKCETNCPTLPSSHRCTRFERERERERGGNWTQIKSKKGEERVWDRDFFRFGWYLFGCTFRGRPRDATIIARPRRSRTVLIAWRAEGRRRMHLVARRAARNFWQGSLFTSHLVPPIFSQASVHIADVLPPRN